MERLARLGIPPALYEDFVTSGEVARSFLAAAPAELRAAGSLGPLHCLPLGSPAGSALMAGLDIIEATSVGEADFLLVASFGQQPPPRDAFDAVLAEARSRGLTLVRSEEHTSELQSLMRISYAVFCLKKKKTKT